MKIEVYPTVVEGFYKLFTEKGREYSVTVKDRTVNYMAVLCDRQGGKRVPMRISCPAATRDGGSWGLAQRALDAYFATGCKEVDV